MGFYHGKQFHVDLDYTKFLSHFEKPYLYSSLYCYSLDQTSITLLSRLNYQLKGCFFTGKKDKRNCIIFFKWHREKQNMLPSYWFFAFFIQVEKNKYSDLFMRNKWYERTVHLTWTFLTRRKHILMYRYSSSIKASWRKTQK